MKRSIADLLRRGFDNAVANWQLTALRIAEVVVFLAIGVAAVLVILVPVIVSMGISIGNLESPEELESLFELFLTRWTLLLWILLGIFILLLVFGLIHSFLEAGVARVFVDAERVAGPAIAGSRSRYRVFSFERFFAGAKDGWWRVFWIYNLIWGVVLLILLVPLIPTLIGMILLRDSEAGLVLVGCLGLVVTMLLMLVVMLVAAVWCNRAIVDWAVRRDTALASVETAWAAIKADFARHILTGLTILLVSFAGSMFISSFSFFASLAEAVGGNEGMVLAMTMPLRLVVSLINSAFSAAIASWFVATYAAIATDPHA